ncbi:MAG: hypothetical protein F6K56_06185 [Moorea sp. SIO3G5]|nr:hypothetical protein [Moorena sp. SIO3G5]
MANAPRVTYGQGIARHHGSHRKVRWGTPELEEKEGKRTFKALPGSTPTLKENCPLGLS